jgi:DNA-binding Lrp family transcriptional regulator
MSTVGERVTSSASREVALARLSFAFLLDEMAGGVAGLDPLDALLVLAINQANIAPLTRDPNARARYGQLEAPAPDAERRPVSINAIAASLGLPFETVRRRIRRLAAADVCTVSGEGVLVPASFLASPTYLRSVMAGHLRLRAFYFDLAARGLVDELPASAYALEHDIPIRAAARLLSDYVLRTSEGLMREAGNVISTLILTALLTAALGEDPAPVAVKAIAAQLKLPAETVRRHVVQMAEDGLCERSTAGVGIPSEMLARAGLQMLFADNAKHVHRLLSGLAERGVILSWETPASQTGLGAA